MAATMDKSKVSLAKSAKIKAKSRAVLRIINPGNDNECPHCGRGLKFSAKNRSKNRQVICNLYSRGKWVRTEHYHEACYIAAGSPCGTPNDSDLKGMKSPTANR